MRIPSSELEYRITEYLLKHMDREALLEGDDRLLFDLSGNEMKEMLEEFADILASDLSLVFQDSYEDVASIITPEWLRKFLVNNV